MGDFIMNLTRSEAFALVMVCSLFFAPFTRSRCHHKWTPVHYTDPNCREAQMVVIVRDASGKPTVWCDPEIADLIRALNSGGIPTEASCSGHGENPGWVALKDGRQLAVLPELDSFKRWMGEKRAAVFTTAPQHTLGAPANCPACKADAAHGVMAAPVVGPSGADWQAVARVEDSGDGLHTPVMDWIGQPAPIGTTLYMKGNAGVDLPDGGQSNG